MNQQALLRNFSIIAHIDHGKTTLTDRLLEMTDTVEPRLMHERYLDSHPIAQERGVTIKLAPVRMRYPLAPKQEKIFNFKFCILNLIDTPGHIDFAYEVSRSLVCCEGAILMVDASQGIQAQTLAHFHQAEKLKLKIIPVINKVDLAQSQPQKVALELESALGFKAEEILYISAKTGQNVDQLLKTVVAKIPPPPDNTDKPLRALVFDSFYHPHKGVVVYLRIKDGVLNKQSLKMMVGGAQFTPLEIGYLTPQMTPTKQLSCGQVGYLATGLKNISLCKVGDTITNAKFNLLAGEKNLKLEPLSGYKEPNPVVFFDFYPVENQNFNLLKQAIEQLKLNDVALTFEPTGSPALGNGFQLGFLGVFHALITQERLEKDFNLNIIATSPSVGYQIVWKNGQTQQLQNASQLKDLSSVAQIKEPWIKAAILTPVRFLGNIMKLCQNSRAVLIDQQYYNDLVNLTYHLPLVGLIEGFYDQLKSVSSGFASLDYQVLDYRPVEALKMEVLIAGAVIDSLASLTEKEKAVFKARALAKKLKAVIPRQLFEVPIQVSLNGQVVARETIKAFRKDVTAKLYGGDQTRKDKLLKKQKKGKKRMKQIGRINIPQEAFMAVLKIDQSV